MTTETKTQINPGEVFNALDVWIKQSPRLDPRDYGIEPSQRYNPRAQLDAQRAYREEQANIRQDATRARKALKIARALDPNPALLADAFRAFSGRLTWNGECAKCAWGTACGTACKGHLSYCTGQYWPTEYRKAAAAVLENYIAAWKQAENAKAPKTFTYSSVADVKAANQSIGNHWFDRSSMAFFNTRIESQLIAGKYFITSDRMNETDPKRYTVRRADPDGTIDTVGEFCQYLSKEDARAAIKAVL